jgi:hypothetical protein
MAPKLMNCFRPWGIALALALSLALPASVFSQGMSPDQIRMILNATKDQWVAVREYDNRDLVYFTQLLTWRCGLSGISYRLNNEAQERPWDIGTCDASNPNAIPDDLKIYLSLPIFSVGTITVTVTYADGAKESVTYTRKAIQIQ